MRWYRPILSLPLGDAGSHHWWCQEDTWELYLGHEGHVPKKIYKKIWETQVFPMGNHLSRSKSRPTKSQSISAQNPTFCQFGISISQSLGAVPISKHNHACCNEHHWGEDHHMIWHRKQRIETCEYKYTRKTRRIWPVRPLSVVSTSVVTINFPSCSTIIFLLNLTAMAACSVRLISNLSGLIVFGGMAWLHCELWVE